MKGKNLIVMIIVLFVVFSGGLAAEEVVGESIFPNIETPHPYPVFPQSAESKTLVWSTTINQPGAAWIKIHFSNFQLNDKDYINLIDEHGRIVEHIRFGDVSGKYESRIKSQKNDDQTFNFWTLAVDGQKLRIELHRESNKSSDWGFTVDEIGIGSKSLFDKGLGPLYSNDEGTGSDIISPPGKNGPGFDLNQMISGEPEGRRGRMLYKNGTTWFTCKGVLANDKPNEFLPGEDCIDSQDIVDTLEVRFYFYCSLDENISSFHHGFYGDTFIDNYFTTDNNREYGLLTLKRNKKMVGPLIKFRKPLYNSIFKVCDCPNVFCPDCDTWFYLCSCCGLCHCNCNNSCPCGCCQ